MYQMVDQESVVGLRVRSSNNVNYFPVDNEGYVNSTHRVNRELLFLWAGALETLSPGAIESQFCFIFTQFIQLFN